MSRTLLVLLVCLPALSLAAIIRCNYGDRTLNPGESYVFESNCAKHNCTCDPAKAGSEMCKSTMIGCFSGSTCHKAGDPATVSGPTGTPLQCVCQLSGGSYTFVNCRSETCRDSRTGEEKKKGESVTVSSGGVTYVCTCAGVDGYQNCRTEESIANDGKCLDQATGKYVETGAPAVTRQGDTVLHCTCAGTNSYSNCRTTTCPDANGGVKQPGEKVSVRSGDILMVCDCAGLEGYKNCAAPDHCQDVSGSYVAKEQPYTVNYGGATYRCICDGNNSGKECTAT